MPKYLGTNTGTETPDALLNAIFSVSKRINRKAEDTADDLWNASEVPSMMAPLQKVAAVGAKAVPWLNPLPEDAFGVAAEMIPFGAIAAPVIKPLTSKVQKVVRGLRAQEAPVPLQKIINLLRKEGLSKTELEDAGVPALEGITRKGNITPSEISENIDELAPNVEPKHSENWSEFTVEGRAKKQPIGYQHTEYYSTGSPVPRPKITDPEKGHLNFFEKKNYPLYHSRSSQMMTESGEPVRLVQEVQSDLHQAAKHLGYAKDPVDPLTPAEREHGKLVKAFSDKAKDTTALDRKIAKLLFFNDTDNLTAEEVTRQLSEIPLPELFPKGVPKRTAENFVENAREANQWRRSGGLSDSPRTGYQARRAGKRVKERLGRVEAANDAQLRGILRENSGALRELEEHEQQVEELWQALQNEPLIKRRKAMQTRPDRLATRLWRTEPTRVPKPSREAEAASVDELADLLTGIGKTKDILDDFGFTPREKMILSADNAILTHVVPKYKEKLAAIGVDYDPYTSDFLEPFLEELRNSARYNTQVKVRDLQARALETPHIKATYTDVIPDIPFKKTWPRQALKDEIRRAVNAGEQQIAIAHPLDLHRGVQPHTYFTGLEYDKATGTLTGTVNATGEKFARAIPPEQLAGHLDESSARELLSTGKTEGASAIKQGFKDFYEKTLPNEMDDIFQRHGIEPRREEKVLGQTPVFLGEGSDIEKVRRHMVQDPEISAMVSYLTNNDPSLDWESLLNVTPERFSEILMDAGVEGYQAQNFVNKFIHQRNGIIDKLPRPFKPVTRPTPTWDLTNPKIKEMVEQGFPLGALLAGVLGYGAYQNQNQPAIDQSVLGM